MGVVFMKIYILDKYKITKFNLPEKIEDSFLISYSGYNNKKDNFITIEAEDNKWQLKSNGHSNIISNSGIIDFISKLLRPIAKILFNDIKQSFGMFSGL